MNEKAVIIGKSDTHEGDISSKGIEIAQQIGEVIATSPTIKMIITGGCSGYPDLVARKVIELAPQKDVIGFPPTESPDSFQMQELVPQNEDHFSLMLVPEKIDDELPALISRSQHMVKFAQVNNCLVIVLGGGIGTQKECERLVDTGLPVIIIKGTGGFADDYDGDGCANVAVISDLSELDFD